MSQIGERRLLLACATLNGVLHLIGLLLAAGAIAPGSPLAPLEARLAYLAGRPLGWSVGWAAWMLCALALVWLLALLGSYAPERAALASPAVALAAAGAAVDLVCDVLQMLELPRLAAAGPASVPVFLAFEQAAGAGGLIVANGLYSAAVLLIVLALRRRLPALAFALGIATFLSGMLMVAAGFTADPRLLPVATGATFAAFLAWLVVVTRGLLEHS
jgi:hypothetical protein